MTTSTKVHPANKSGMCIKDMLYMCLLVRRIANKDTFSSFNGELVIRLGIEKAYYDSIT